MDRHYRIYILNSRNSVDLAYDLVFSDDVSALLEADTFAERNAVEVWSGARLVGQIACRRG